MERKYELKVVDNNLATLLLTEIENSTIEYIADEEDKVYFLFGFTSMDNLNRALQIQKDYSSYNYEVKINLKKYNYNRKMLLKNISHLKNREI